MKKTVFTLLSIWFLSVGMALGQREDNSVPTPPAPLPDTDFEALSRGPVHEAFAEPLAAEESERLVVEQEPPAPVEELPPEGKPEGENVEWIPGYWSWDDERSDYIWVSGVWRRLPPGRHWEPGKWQQVEGGYEWVSGRWLGANHDVVAEVIPAPPASLEEGPASPAPSQNHFWVPGCWRYQVDRYVWRPGFWSVGQDNWVWVPDSYVTVTGGCNYVPGYWDYAWERRGVLYAPCYFPVARRHVVYRPSVVISLSASFGHLWVRPSCRHYYFGDYYDDVYVGLGYCPWYRYQSVYRHAYDPLFVHYRWRYGHDGVDLYRQLHHRHDHYRQHQDLRPSRVFAHQGRPGGGGPTAWHRPVQGDNQLAHHISDHKRVGPSTSTRESIRRELLASQQDGDSRRFRSSTIVGPRNGQAGEAVRRNGSQLAGNASNQVVRDRQRGSAQAEAAARAIGPRGAGATASASERGAVVSNENTPTRTKGSAQSGRSESPAWLDAIRSSRSSTAGSTDASQSSSPAPTTVTQQTPQTEPKRGATVRGNLSNGGGGPAESSTARGTRAWIESGRSSTAGAIQNRGNNSSSVRVVKPEPSVTTPSTRSTPVETPSRATTRPNRVVELRGNPSVATEGPSASRTPSRGASSMRARMGSGNTVDASPTMRSPGRQTPSAPAIRSNPSMRGRSMNSPPAAVSRPRASTVTPRMNAAPQMSSPRASAPRASSPQSRGAAMRSGMTSRGIGPSGGRGPKGK